MKEPVCFPGKSWFLPFTNGSIFRQFEFLAGTEKEMLKKLCEHFLKSWLENTVWKPKDAVCFGKVIRTNNDVEGFHFGSNQKAGYANLKLHVLLKLLKDDPESIDLSCALGRNGVVLRFPKSQTNNPQYRLFKLRALYQAGEMTAGTLLKHFAYSMRKDGIWH